MSDFDTRAFLAEKFEPRTAEVSLLALRPWYPPETKDDELVWTVRGLTAVELAQCEVRAVGGRKSTLAILETLRKANHVDGIEQLEKNLGLNDKVPEHLAKKLEHVKEALINPKVSLELVVKLAAVFPIEFGMLHRKIEELTGLGQEAVKKAVPSGTIQESAPDS